MNKIIPNPNGIPGTVGEVFTEEELEQNLHEGFDWEIWEMEKDQKSLE